MSHSLNKLSSQLPNNLAFNLIIPSPIEAPHAHSLAPIAALHTNHEFLSRCQPSQPAHAHAHTESNERCSLYAQPKLYSTLIPHLAVSVAMITVAVAVVLACALAFTVAAVASTKDKPSHEPHNVRHNTS